MRQFVVQLIPNNTWSSFPVCCILCLFWWHHHRTCLSGSSLSLFIPPLATHFHTGKSLSCCHALCSAFCTCSCFCFHDHCPGSDPLSLRWTSAVTCILPGLFTFSFFLLLFYPIHCQLDNFPKHGTDHDQFFWLNVFSSAPVFCGINLSIIGMTFKASSFQCNFSVLLMRAAAF